MATGSTTAAQPTRSRARRLRAAARVTAASPAPLAARTTKPEPVCSSEPMCRPNLADEQQPPHRPRT